MPRPQEPTDRVLSALTALSFTVVLIGPLLYTTYSSPNLLANNAKDLRNTAVFTLFSACAFLALTSITASARRTDESAPLRENIISNIVAGLSGNRTLLLQGLKDLIGAVYDRLLRDQVSLLADGYQNLAEGITYVSGAVQQAISAPAPGRQAPTQTPP